MDIKKGQHFSEYEKVDFSSIKIPQDIEVICVDTRDFYMCVGDSVMSYTDDKVKKNQIKELKRFAHNNQYRENEFVFSTEEMMKTLNDLKTWSGGDGSWRLLSFIDAEDKSGWDYKYLVFFKIDKDKWIMVNRMRYSIVFKSILREDNINKEVLGFH